MSDSPFNRPSPQDDRAPITTPFTDIASSTISSLARPLAIVGAAGISGRATLRLLKIAGVDPAEVILFDEADSAAQFKDGPTLIREAAPKTLVVSPGVPLQRSWLRDAVAQGAKITSELNVAAQFLEGEKVVGVTGSLGKSTTVSLLGDGLKAAGIESFVGGNLGIPLAAYASDVLEGRRKRAQCLVLELSSFQLENASSLSFDAAGLTYLSPNHLERYPDLQSYYNTKWRLVEQTRGPLVMNKRGGDLWEYASTKSEFERIHWTSEKQSSLTSEEFSRAQLVGAHNRDNLALATALYDFCCELCSRPRSTRSGLLDFAGLPHRVRRIGNFGGVSFIDDSKATTMESVLTATESVLEDSSGSVWLLLGGRDKKLPWKNLGVLAKNPRLRFVFFGECRALAQNSSGLSGKSLASLRETLSILLQEAQRGDTILLSPGGSSLDEFKNFEDRGRVFAELATTYFGKD